MVSATESRISLLTPVSQLTPRLLQTAVASVAVVTVAHAVAVTVETVVRVATMAIRDNPL